MKIKVVKKSLKDVLKTPSKRLKKVKRPNILFRTLLKIVSSFDLMATNFQLEKINMDKLNKKEPCLILMNHSSFIDLKICMNKLYPRPFNVITTSDGFVSKNWLMRQIGCIPTKKHTVDTKVVKDILYAVRKLNNSILMYPEASYSFDGTCTTMLDNLGKLAKLLKIPVVTIITQGAFLRQPLYNNLKLRKVNVKAKMEYVLSKEDILEKTEEKINSIIKSKFDFDDFKYQQENNIIINNVDRGEGLSRVLYKCPSCMNEGNLLTYKHILKCPTCNKEYELNEFGFMKAKNGVTEIDHIPSWYKWERSCVRKEIEEGTYHFEDDVDILVMKDTYTLYDIGEGHLIHDINGFKLASKENDLEFNLDSKLTYSSYSDFYWYQIGDMVCIGDSSILYYCFPKKKKDVVAKIRLATEEIYKYRKENNI